MTAATFRNPGPLAISVAQVDQMSGGRVELGMGAGWYEGEHTAYGIPFPPLAERFDRYEEQLAVITGLWATPDGETFSFEGTHYRLADSPALPKPAQRPHPPVIIGGDGPTVLDRVLAFGDAWMPNFGPSDIIERAGQLRARADRPISLQVMGVPADPAVFEAWRSGHIHETFKGGLTLSAPRKAEALVLDFLRAESGSSGRLDSLAA